MAIHRVEIKDFLVFQGKFDIEFCPGVNVLIGGNGTGKTTLLKLTDVKNFATRYTSNTSLNVIIPKLRTVTADNGDYIVNITGDYDADKTIFIPVAEMLQHSKGLLELTSTYEMPFDYTQINILINAGLPITREIMPNAKKVIGNVSKVIDGGVVYEDGKYYIVKNSGLKVDFSLEASGYQKFGLLWKLLRNGLLEKGSVLFWDEPEASINPELMSVLVEILLELQRGGVQIFLATHSEILASYFEVKSTKNDNVMFYSLFKDGEQIKADKSEKFGLLEPNFLTAEQVKLYECEIEKGLGNGQ
jgi:predicted ATPase